ncbi:MAG: hypothetical protein IKD74_02595 [Clostridia bacterium]|nr:hypothetical protein [Clostridia bacterium]
MENENKTKDIIVTILKVVAIIFLVCIIVLNIIILFKEEPMTIIKETTTEKTTNNSYNFWEQEITFCWPHTVTRSLVPSIIVNIVILICAIVEIIIPISNKKIKAFIITLTLIIVIVSLFIPVVNSYQTYDNKRLTYLKSYSIITYYFGKI